MPKQRMLLSELWAEMLREMSINVAFMYFQTLFLCSVILLTQQTNIKQHRLV